MKLYFKNSKYSTKKLLELTNELSKVAGYKVNIQKSVAFCIPIRNYQKEKLKNNLIYNCIKNNEINLTKNVKDLYSENCDAE